MDDIFRGVGVEVTLPTSDDFLRVKETLTRIGTTTRNSNELIQSCYILHKQGRYAIVHLHEMYMMDGDSMPIPSDDIARRDTVAKLLNDWGLVRLLRPIEDFDLRLIKIVPFRDKPKWKLVSKYQIGKKHLLP